MARESHRPTKTNYQDYLFDFSNVDFSQYAGQDRAQGADVAAQQTDEPGFLSRLGNTALAIGEGLTMLPGGIVDTVRDTWHGGDIDVTDTEALREREERARQQAAYVQKYQGKAFDGVADAMISMPYSLATMGASLGAGIPATMAMGPVAGGAAGMAASGAVAYRASKQNFMENMLAETTKVLGRTPTQDEWDRIAQEFDSEATQYGLWEAGPEALSNLFMAKLLGPLGKRVFSGGIGNAAKRVAGLYGEEMATETITQMGQGPIEADLGLRDEAPGVLQALGEVAPATFWQTTLMAGGKKGLDLLSRRYGRGQQVEDAPAPDQQEGSQARPEASAAGQNNTAPASDFDSLSGPEWNAPEARIDEAMWNREASARGWNHLRTDAPKPVPNFIPGDPFTDPAAAQDTEDFVRRFEEAEQTAGEDTTGMAQSLDQGKTVDLLAPHPLPEDSPAPGRPSTPVKPSPAVHAPIPGPDIPRQASPLLSPWSNDGIPVQPGQQGMAAPAFPVEPSPLLAGGVLAQMGQAGSQQQPPVTAVPTQAQLTNIQATPRADTTAPAEALGMPAPDAIPREAQPAPQAGDMATPSAMPVQPSVARPVVPMPEMTPMDAPRQEAPDASPRREEQPAPAQTAPEGTDPLMYRGVLISRMPIGDDRRENQADSILQAAEQKAKTAGDARMQAAVAEIQRERKHVGVTHDALWDRINSDILPYAAEDAHDATQQTSPQDDFLRDHLVVATITAPADTPMPPRSEGTVAKRQKTGKPSVAEQRKAILQSLPEDLRKAHKGAPLSKLKELAAQQRADSAFSRVVAHVPANAIRRNGDQSAIEVAKAWIREHISSPVQTKIGTVDVDANAIQDSLSHSMYQNKLDAIQAIVPVLEKGEYLGTLPDKDGKPIDNYYFAGKVQIGESEKIVFIRTREAKGMPNRFYVHEVFTQEEIEKSGGIRGVTSDADRPFRNSPDFYRRLLADYLKVKEAGRSEQPSAGGQPSANGASYGTVDKPDTIALANHFSAVFLAGGKFGTIVEARREAASLLGGAVRPATETAKAVDEAIELGVTLAARKTVAEMRERRENDTAIYRALVDLYQRQPRLSVRTSTSMAQQAYSTPAPIAFLASRLAGIDTDTKVFEPTAGNGMLLMEADPKNTTANELNADRAARLRSQGFTVSERDAVDYAPSGMDVVIANPPFGRVMDADRQTREFSVHDLTTRELDHAIVARALGALKQGGRAVLIIGGKQGNDASRSKKYRAADQVNFWGWLFDHYRVLDHFSVDGKLYERQGAGYPIDIIVLENSGPSRGRVFPGAALPRSYTSFGDLEEVLHGQVVDAAERTPGTDGPDTGRVGDGPDSQSGRADRAADAEIADADRGRVRSGRDAGTDGARSGKRLDPRVRDDRSAETGGGRILGSERPAGESGNDVSADAEGGRAGGTGQSDLAADGHRGDTGERRGRDDAGRVGELGDSGDVRPELGVSSPARQQKTGHKPAAAQKPKATEFQVAYEPASSMQSMGTLVPKNMATAARQALADLEKRHGGIDQYVADQLGYPAAELGNYFAAEQVDALGMAISNIADGSGFIIGDQTGIGKGRVNAGIIRWAKRQGYIPVFVTMKPDLYADMVRDLADIGMEGFTPLPTNAGLSGSDAILLPDGRELKTKSAQAHEKILRDVMQNGMGAYDAVFTTYDQLNPVKGQDTFRRQFMMDIAPNAVFILDESHNAGGQASTRKKANAADDRAQFVRKMLQSSRQGTFYSSATYAKRPDVMSLYFKTDMQYAADDMGKLAEAIERGGIPMQQAVAAELTETGQYLRRERSFEGAEVQTSTVSINKDRAEKTADIMRAIMAFDDAKEAAVEAADKAAAKTGGSVGDNKSTGKGGASSTNFTAVMHNVIAQSLLAQKVDAVVEAAANDVARGEKVVIALSNTMGSMIKEFAEQNGIAVGSPINFTFNDMFVRYLEKSRMIAIKKAGQKKAETKRRLTDEELGPDGVQAYNNALAVIRNSDFGGLQVSVIDRMLAEFEARGIKADEITGRTERIDYTTDVPTYAKRTTGPSDRIRVVDEFNSGKLDVVILNQAGSTGISLHSSERFKDQRRRNMIIAQAESNIDVFMQTLGRVFRTGQVVPPTYQLIMSDLPAEKRPAAVLAKKMSSLNANTTASKDSDTSFKNIPDFLNKYGDRVAKQVMDENPELSKKLGSPVKEDGEDAMRKVTGRIPLLPVKEQEQLYALLESEYNDLIAQLEAMGGTGLEAKSLPLDARLLDEVEIVPAKDVGKDTPFAGAARIGTYDVKKLGKPWPSAKVKEMVQAADVPDTEKLFQEAQVWHGGKVRDMSDEAAANQQNRLNLARGVIADAARMRPGTPVLISGENLLMEGIMLRLYHKGSAENPLALSTWKMDIALPDASRKITIPLSQTVRKEDALTVTPSHRDPEVMYGMFDSAQRESREKAHIITGNILAAFQKVNGKGNVITFQDHEGNTIPGIMLPKDTDPQKLLDGMDVSLSPDAAIRFLRGLPGKAAVKTADKLLVLSHDGSDFTVSVPSSKAKGAQYFLNRDVLEAAGQDFIRSGQSMVLRHLSEGQAAGILQALSGQGYGFVADNNRNEARKIMADTDSQALASLASRPARRPDSLPSRFADMPTIEADSTQWFGPGKAIGADSRNMRKAVYDWARTAFPQGTTVANADTGWRVQVTPSGIKASLHHGYDELLARSVPFIPQIVESGIHLDSIEKKPGLMSHIFANKIRLDGQDYVVGFVLREDDNGNRFYDHELTKIISPDWLVPGHPSSEGPSSEGSSGHRTNRGIPSDWLKPGPALQEGNVVHRTNRGDVMNILRERLGVNDGTGQVLFRTAGQFLPPKFKGRRAPSMEAVRRLADKMNGMAANAARVEIVENAGDLPQNLRDAYASQADSVEGLYDPATDTVWLVAENLESLERAAEVWLHENVVHHGLRSALAPAQRRLLLNQLWHIMGGMGNSSIRDIASRYGRDPRSNEAARLLIMEEALANLAERRAQGMLRSTQEQSLWRRVVDAIVRAWNGMVYTLTGRRGRMGRSQMERLLDALQGHVMEGRPVAMPDAALQEGTDSAGAFASLSADQQEAARAAWGQLQKDEDVVKPADPGRGGENTPLASLASRPSSLTESVASGIRALRKVMGRGVSADVEDVLSNREMGTLIPRHDLSLAERLFKLPHWVAKDHAGFARVYDRQLRRVEERSAALKASLEQVPLLFDGDASKRLGPKEQEQLAAMIWKWDGKQIGPLNAIEKFNVVDQTVNGRDVLELNPDYQKKFRAWLKEQPEPERVKQAFGQVREALDAAFLRAYNKMAAMSDLADTDLEMYRTEFGSIHNYFPHQRTGKYFVVARVGKETVFRKHFDVPLGSSVREEWAKIVAEHRKDFPNATWDGPREAQKLPDEILGAPIDTEAMEQIISAAASRLGNSEQAERVRSTLLSGVADVLKARGFGAHGIHRQNIPGFETQDVKGVLYSYMAGLNGWLTKMEAAADFARALGKIDASASPRLWEYAAQYTKDMLRNSDQIDRITGNIKSVAFAWYLGGNIKTAVVNLTQNAVVGVPRLQQYVTGGGTHWLKSAMDTIGLTYSGKGLHGAKKLTDEEAAMLQELYGNSVITDAYMEEVRGQVSTSPSLRMWERFTRLLGWPMSKVEIFNRASLALAAYRAARVGAFKAKALKEYGLEPGQKMTHEQARDFAAMLVRDTHFEYGRGNQPEFLRSNVAGRMLSPVFTFRSFGANILNLWWRALLYEGKEGRAFVAQSLGATVALGGLTAFPFYATLAALCAAASGDDEDWTAKIRNALPANNLLRDVACYGLPSLLGVNIGGSLRMETPFTEGMKRGETFKEAMTESLGDLLGIPYDLAVNKPSKFLEARRFGADYRAVEALVPTFVANAMQAWRLSTEGQTTLRGRPINSPGQPGARKLSTGEAFGKALGFQPTSSTKSYEAYAAEKRRTSMRSDRIDDFTNQALDDLESKGRPYMMRELQEKLQTWNKEMEAEGKPAMKIMPKDVLRRVAARRRENRPTRDQREKGAAQMATWGV